MKAVHMIAWVLVIIGGLNWLLVGIFGRDLFVMIGFGMTTIIPRIVYILVGLSAVMELFTHKSSCKVCSAPSSAPQM